jgi:hypothetical protein
VNRNRHFVGLVFATVSLACTVHSAAALRRPSDRLLETTYGGSYDCYKCENGTSCFGTDECDWDIFSLKAFQTVYNNFTERRCNKLSNTPGAQSCSLGNYSPCFSRRTCDDPFCLSCGSWTHVGSFPADCFESEPCPSS